MVGYRLAELLVVHLLPCCRDYLLGRVSKKIGVMEVHHQGQTCFLHAFGHCKHIGKVAPAGGVVHPHAKANGIHACVLIQTDAVCRTILCVIKKYAVMLHFGEPTEVGSANGVFGFELHRFRLFGTTQK